MTQDVKRKASWVIQNLIPIALLALISWLCLETVQRKVDVSDLKHEVAVVKLIAVGVKDSLEEHNALSVGSAAKNAVLHHRSKIGRCDGCHEDMSNGRSR